MPLEVSIDSTTWAALALTLTIIGAALSWVAWRRRGLAAGPDVVLRVDGERAPAGAAPHQPLEGTSDGLEPGSDVSGRRQDGEATARSACCGR